MIPVRENSEVVIVYPDFYVKDYACDYKDDYAHGIQINRIYGYVISIYKESIMDIDGIMNV